MPDRIKPRDSMVIQVFMNEGKSETPVGGRIEKVHGDMEVDIEYYVGGETKRANNVPMLHALDPAPDEGIYARFPPRPDVASERHLLHPDRTATEGDPQRGESADPRVPPTIEHVTEDDPVARSAAGIPDTKEAARKSAKKQPDPSLRKR